MVNGEVKDQLSILKVLSDRASSLPQQTVTLGFDGFVDHVVRVIHHKDDDGLPSYFESIQALGEYILEKGQNNFSLEFEEITTKLGGNMPIMANAFAQLGLLVSCIGPLGHPSIHPLFEAMPPNCRLHSFANPGVSKIMEFKRGKMMLSEMQALSRIPWEFIKQTIGVGPFNEMFSKSDLIALVNWSELDNSSDIWKGLLRDVLPNAVRNKRPLGFFDLSDCSKRTEASICEALQLIAGFSAYWNVVLSLNLNEASIVYSALTQKKAAQENVDEMCTAIFDALRIDTVVIHYDRQSVARGPDGLQKRKSFFIEEPVISSGSGDNFNAGFCTGRLMDLDIGTSLVLGNATASLYMQSGFSPKPAELLEFLANNLSDWQAVVAVSNAPDF